MNRIQQPKHSVLFAAGLLAMLNVLIPASAGGNTETAINVSEPSDSSSAAKVSGTALAPFRTEYTLSAFGLSGDATIELVKTDQPNEYIYKSRTQATGLAKLVRPDAAIESSRFLYVDDKIYVQEYDVDAGTGDPLENSYARFDWNLGIVYSNHQEEKVELVLEEGILDRFSADLQVMLDLRAGKTPDEYTMVHRNAIKTYKFIYEGREKIKTGAGTFETIKYLRQRPGSSRSAYIWYAPELGYQPVKVIQLKKGKKRGILLLQSIDPD